MASTGFNIRRRFHESLLSRLYLIFFFQLTNMFMINYSKIEHSSISCPITILNQCHSARIHFLVPDMSFENTLSVSAIIISSIYHPVYKIHGYSKKHIYIFTSPQSKRYVSKVKRKEEKKGKKLTFLSQSSLAGTCSSMILLNSILLAPIFQFWRQSRKEARTSSWMSS